MITQVWLVDYLE